MRKGYVTVFFAIAIYICMSLFIGLMYGARESAVRARAGEAAEVSIRSVFGEYQKELWKEYNLIFVDATYGYDTDSFILPEEHYIGYLNENFDEGGLALLSGKDLLKISASFAETDEIRLATDNAGAAVRAQAVNFMKHKYGLAHIQNLFEATQGYEAVYEEVSEAQEPAEELPESPVLEEWKEAYGDTILGDKDVSLLSSLRLVIKDVSDISGVQLNKNALVSGRALNKGNSTACKKSDLTDNLFFKEYLLEYTNNYLNKEKDTVLSYETEYLIAGKDVDSHNLESVVNRILLTREVMNMAALKKDEKRMNTIKIFSQVVTGAILKPELAPALEASVVSLWSFAESVGDIKLLLQGKKVPFMKSEDEWQTSLRGFFSKEKKEGYERGLTYRDYLRMFVAMADTETLTKRFMDLCELNVRKWTERDGFRLDFCFDRWVVTAYLQSEFGYQYTIKRQYDLE